MGTPNKNRINRREFIGQGIRGYSGFTLANGLSASMIASLSCSVEDTSTRTVFGACYHDCPDACSWTVSAEDGKVTFFAASKTNPYTAGRLCEKMDQFPRDVTFHPDRILTPLKRLGKKGEGSFQAVSWEEAISDVAQRLNNIIESTGARSILPYSYAGTEGLVQRNSIGSRFFAKLGASRLKATICGDTAIAGVTSVYGQTTGVLPKDLIHSRYIIFWGTNPVISNQHLWRLAEKARDKGARIVVIDPFKSDTATVADWHIQPHPGTDVLLALSMIDVLIKEDLHDSRFIAQNTIGFRELRDHVSSYSPERVAQTVGLEPGVIRKLALEYGKADPSLIRFLIGMEHQANGASAFRAVSMLPAITGAWKKRGGGFMHMTYELFGQALNWENLSISDEIQDKSIREINMVQIGSALNQKEDPIQGLFVYNTNPAVIAPDQNAVMEGLQRQDLFTVVLEHFITDTARYADYIFPATTQLEHWDLLTSWGTTHLNLNQPVIPPLGESKPNTEFFRLLASEMRLEEDFLYESDLDIIKKALDSDHPLMANITFDYLKEHGWAQLNIPENWMPFQDGKINTHSGKIELFNSKIADPLPVYRRPVNGHAVKSKFPLRILTIKSTRNFLNSSHANVSHLLKKEGEPMLDINPADATQREITDGSRVKVFNERGVVILKARISEKVKEGIICLPQGYWPSLMEGGRSANALTSDLLTDMGEGPAYQETFAEVMNA